MSSMSSGILAFSELLDFQFEPFFLCNNDFGDNRCARYCGSTDDTCATAIGEQHLVKRNRSARFDLATIIHRQERTFLNTMLTITVYDHSKHRKITFSQRRQRKFKPQETTFGYLNKITDCTTPR